MDVRYAIMDLCLVSNQLDAETTIEIFNLQLLGLHWCQESAHDGYGS